MGKLRLKRTPEEQVAHDLRKAQKRARKAAAGKHRRSLEDDSDDSCSRKRAKTTSSHGPDDYGFIFDDADVDLEGEAGPSHSHSHRAHKPDLDYASIQAQVEEERFREKLAGAFDDDERLDSVEARLNSYGHIPRRWRGGGMERMDDELDVDPQYMEEEDYAEWMRAGMWKCVLVFDSHAVT